MVRSPGAGPLEEQRRLPLQTLGMSESMVADAEALLAAMGSAELKEEAPRRDQDDHGVKKENDDD